jgi:hypothetical protein
MVTVMAMMAAVVCNNHHLAVSRRRLQKSKPRAGDQ